MIAGEFGRKLKEKIQEEKNTSTNLNEQFIPDNNENYFKWKENNVKFQTVVSPNPYVSGKEMRVNLVCNIDIPKEFFNLILGVTERLTAFSMDGRKISEVIGTNDGTYGTLKDLYSPNPDGKIAFSLNLPSDSNFIQDIMKYANGKSTRILVSFTPRLVDNLKHDNFYKANPAILVLN